MSNKLVKNKQNLKNNKTFYLSCLFVLCSAFIFLCIDVHITSNSIKNKINNMVLGEDYFQEEIVITNKRAESFENGFSEGSIQENYFFYYDNGSLHEYHKRMQVPAVIYKEYDVGDKIKAYTINHESYSYEPYGIITPGIYRNNEIKKAISIVIGAGILSMVLILLQTKKDKKHT